MRIAGPSAGLQRYVSRFREFTGGDEPIGNREYTSGVYRKDALLRHRKRKTHFVRFAMVLIEADCILSCIELRGADRVKPTSNQSR